MTTVRLDGKKINGQATFHDESQAAFGFPDFYGRNMDAWVDALCSLRDPEGEGMTRFALGPDDTLQIAVLHADQLRRQAPEIFDFLKEGAEAVNETCVEMGQKPVVRLVLL
jgi:hypothetical protein